MIKYGIPLSAMLALAFAVGSVSHNRPMRISVPPPEAPAAAPFPHNLAAVGLVEASTENIAISTPVAGLVSAVYVKPGGHVQADQKLFALDDRDLQAELEVRQNSLEVARSRLHKLMSMPRTEELPAAEARVQEAEAALADANMQLALIERVTDRRAISEEELQRRRFASQAASAKLKQARAELALLRAGSWEPDIKVARAEVLLAESQYKRVQTDIERLTVRAPIAGEILQSNIRVGEYAQVGSLAKPLMLLGNLSPLHVRVDIGEHDAWRFRPGASAIGNPRGHTNLRFPLQFVRTEPYVVPKKSLTGDSTERVDTRVLQVIYRFNGGKGPVYAGQQMDVFIETPASRGHS
jgi:HlyD family secretion protein